MLDNTPIAEDNRRYQRVSTSAETAGRPPRAPSVAIVHDYLTQRGGAERVVLSMLKAFPEASLYTSVYNPDTTYEEFQTCRVRTLSAQRLSAVRRNHRLGFPLYAHQFSGLKVSADIVLCSSSGWAHGVTASTGTKIVYCYTPARWLYLPEQYTGDAPVSWRLALRALRGNLIKWDQRAAQTADIILTSSDCVRERIKTAWARDATVLPPPVTITESGTREAVTGLPTQFLLVVTRLLPYKNVDKVLAASEKCHMHTVVVGRGPDERRLRTAFPWNATFLGRVSEAQLRWLYANCVATVSAAHEDFGLTPLESNLFGRPAIVLRAGGFLDTVEEGRTGLYFDHPAPESIGPRLVRAASQHWNANYMTRHAARFCEARFVDRLRSFIEYAASAT